MTAATLQNPDNHSKKAPAWRDVLPVHDAANLFPLISKDELGELAADIAKNGLLERIAVHFDREGKCQLLDGRNRLDALQSLGRNLFDDKGNLLSDLYRKLENDSESEIVAFIVSKNIRRRHLTAEQKRDLLVKLLKADPTKSDRQIAKMVGCDHKTASKKRREEEGRGEIPHVKRRSDSKGRKQPARKARTASPAKPKSNTTPTNTARLAAGGLAHLWGKSTPEQRSKFVNSVGLEAIFAAAPRNLQELFLAQLARGATV